MPSRKKLDLLFHCLTCHANWSPTPVFIIDNLPSVLKSLHPFIHSPLTQTTVSILNLLFSVDFRRFYTFWPQKTNNASLLFQAASWQWSSHVVRPTAQAQTAWSSRPLYDILLKSHFVSRNKIFRCAYFSMHSRIKFLLFNDFPSYLLNKLHWFCRTQQRFMLIASYKYATCPGTFSGHHQACQ